LNIFKRTIDHTSRSDVFKIIPIGDSHIGNIGFYRERLIEDVKRIAEDDNAYTVLMGDICESITIADKRFDPRSIDKRYHVTDLSHLIRRQLEDAVDYLAPLKGKVLGVLAGNHEEKIRLTAYYDVSLELARELNAPYLGYDGFIRLNFIRRTPNSTKQNSRCVETIDIYANHGHGGGRRNGSKVNVLDDASNIFDCDIVYMGHGHKKIIAPPMVRLGLDKNCNLVQKKKYSVMTGSFLKGYVEDATTYVEKQLYTPADLGTVTTYIRPGVDGSEKRIWFEM